MRPISGFVEQCCLLAQNARYPAVDLYLTYVHWCLNHGVPVQDQYTFLEMLECYGSSTASGRRARGSRAYRCCRPTG
jgi:hypothetical protein